VNRKYERSKENLQGNTILKKQKTLEKLKNDGKVGTKETYREKRIKTYKQNNTRILH